MKGSNDPGSADIGADQRSVRLTTYPPASASLRLVAAGTGVSPVSQMIALEPPDGIRFQRLEPPIRRNIYALTRPGVVRPAVRELVSRLVAVGEEFLDHIST